jgi:2-C-methyl-D-erythritol 4-phosphate cytidylyltransferase/2-C-methyl-D-erythritol 2,4-cyclodiphosphate synthase
VLVVAPADMERARALVAAGPSHLTEKVVLGGAERRDSVWCGLQQLTEGTDTVLIHDAARPFITHETIDACLAAVHQHGAAVVARPIADTIKRAATDGHVDATLDRRQLWGAQTPQGFRTDRLRAAYTRAMAEQWLVTDDAAVVERAGYRVQLVEGPATNFKITQVEDLMLAERLLSGPTRTGFGYDVHQLVSGRPLILGGVTIPHPTGLLGHSDADVLTHALMDALLGAAALGDIGQHFPDSAACYQGASSLGLLAAVQEKLAAAGFAPYNIDVTLAAQAPKIAPYIADMRARIAATLHLEIERVSIKATTTEGLGFVGTQAGMAAYATASVLPIALREL